MVIPTPPTRPDLFAEALREWMQRLGLKQREIAAEAHVTESTLSHWLRGDRPPDVESGLWLLMALHRRFREFQEDWTVTEVLDGIAPLGWSWEDIWRTLTRRVVESSGEQSFRDWWRAGKPRPLPPPARSVPTYYVERTEQSLLLEMVTTWDHWRQARWDAVVVTGLSGTGKTTLLAWLIRHPWVRRTFRDGILWLEGAEKERKRWHLVEQACWSAGLEARGPSAPTAWARWAGCPERRLLLVIDDLVMNSIERVEDLAALVSPKGPQVVVVITTQQGIRVREALEEWFPPERVREWILGGLREEEGLALMEKMLGRSIGPAERSEIQRIGDALGWHPAALWAVKDLAQSRRWEAVRQGLERANLPGQWERVVWTLEQQWERTDPRTRREVTRLMWRTLQGGPMEPLLAEAIWEGWLSAFLASGQGKLQERRVQNARHRLEELASSGLVEEVTLHPTEWWREGTVRMWRVAPTLRQVLLGKAGNGRKRWERLKREMWWMWMFLTRGWYREDLLPPMPPSLALVGWLPNLLAAAVRLPVLLSLEWREKRQGTEGIVRKWVRGKALGLPGTRLRKHWEHFRVWPSEEVERVNRQIGWSIILMSLLLAVANGLEEVGRWQMARGMGDIPPLMQMALHLYWVGFGVLTVWMAILFVTPLWECVLYGVQERELEWLVRAAMRVSRVLQQLGPLREREEWLKRAWEQWEKKAAGETGWSDVDSEENLDIL